MNVFSLIPKDNILGAEIVCDFFDVRTNLTEILDPSEMMDPFEMISDSIWFAW